MVIKYQKKVWMGIFCKVFREYIDLNELILAENLSLNSILFIDWLRYLSIFIYLFCGLGLNSAWCTLKAVSLSLELHLQSILHWLFWRWGLLKSLPRLAWNPEPLISASQVVKIICMSHLCLATTYIFSKDYI
jgi:hypothetical protein